MSVLAKCGDKTPRRILSGQNLGHSNFDPRRSYNRNVGRLSTVTGKLPALLAVDYGYDAFPDDFAPTNLLLRRHYQRLGLVSISMHPPNPWHQSESHDLRIDDLRRLLDSDEPAHRHWMMTLDHVAQGLSELQDAGVVVLWRPLHEMNGGWFWWGARQEDNGRWVSRDEFVALWRHMHEYFTQQKQLDNLLWVYSAAVQNNAHHRPADYYYPGHEYVDVVGLDWYDDDLVQLDRFQSYSQMVALDKPLGLTEFGPSKLRDGSFKNTLLLTTLNEQYPRIGFFVYWHSWPGAKVAMVDQRYSNALIHDPRVVSLDATVK